MAIAMLDWSVADERYPSHSNAMNLQEGVEAALLGKGPVRWIERTALDAAADELMLSRLGGANDPAAWLQVGRWVQADLLFTSEIIRQDNGWVLRGLMIDAERADVLSTWSTPAVGDPDQAFDAEFVDLPVFLKKTRRGLLDALREYKESRTQTMVAAMFFENRTEVGRRLDFLEPRLMEGLRVKCEAKPTHRLLRFPSAVEGGDEYRLVLAGLVEGDPMGSRDLADVYVWGHYEEYDWQGVVFEEVPVRLTIHVWNGRDRPEVLTFEGKAGALGELVERSTRRVVDWASDQPNTNRLDRDRSAEVSATIYERIRALQGIQGGNELSVTPAYLERWRNVVRLLETAYFFDPSNAELHREMIAERWRGDLEQNGQYIFTQPRRDRERYLAVARHIDRYGYDQRWEYSAIKPGSGMKIIERRLAATDMKIALLSEGRNMLWVGRLGWLKDTPDDIKQRQREAAAADYRRRVTAMLEAFPEPELAAAALRSIGDPYTPAEQVEWIEMIRPKLGPNPSDALRREWAERVRHIYEAAGDPDGAERWLAHFSEPESATPRPPRSEAAEQRRQRWIDSLRIPEAIQPPQATLEVADTAAGSPAAADPASFAARHGIDLDEIEVTAALANPTADPGSIWFTTNGAGIIRLDRAKRTTQAFGPTDGLTATRFRAVGQTTDTLIFVGGEWGEIQQLCFYRPESAQWTAVALPPPPESRDQPMHAKHLAVVGEHIVVAGDDYGGWPQMLVYDLAGRRWTDLRAAWIAHLEANPGRMPIKPKRPGKKLLVRALAGDLERGVFWIGSPYGLTRYDPDKNAFTTWFSQAPREPDDDSEKEPRPRIFEDVTAIAPVGEHLLVATFSWRSVSYFVHDPIIGGSYLFLLDAATGEPIRYAKLKHEAAIYRITPRGREAWLNRQVFNPAHPVLRAVDWTVLLDERP